MKGRFDIVTADSVTGDALGRCANSARRPKASGSAKRLETLWAWMSLLMLILCWDAALRLDQRVSVPRVRIAHAAESAQPAPAGKWAEL